VSPQQGPSLQTWAFSISHLKQQTGSGAVWFPQHRSLAFGLQCRHALLGKGYVR
jgi:hypothetical protein